VRLTLSIEADMAEIRVEPKRHGTSKAWLWILLLLIIVGTGFWFYSSGRMGKTASRTDTTTDSVAGAVAPTSVGATTGGASTGAAPTTTRPRED